mmetsp:Transcript_89411/g.239627  ORF Transcript_89411/g.239627 Transcript_89411/m.239627 type:complete len:815 (+) Transcript_89411:30-2474(+)
MRWLPAQCQELSQSHALVAVTDGGIQRWTYSAAGDVICRVASFLQSASEPQSRILLAVTDGAEWPLFSLGILLSGNILIPCDLDDAPTRLAGMIADAAPTLVIATPQQAERIFNVTGKSFPVSCPNEVLQAPLLTDLGQDPSAESISHIFFTSGSTGRPKGCICSTENLAHYMESSVAVRQIDRESVVLVASAATFDPSLGDFVATFRAGACMVLPPRNCLGTELASLIEEAGCTHVQTTPSMLSTLTSQPSFRLRSLFLGGEVTPQSLVEHWKSVSVVCTTYGVTECCVYQASRRADGQRQVGTPFSGVQLVVAGGDGSDPHRQAEDGKLGELWIAGAQVGLGYTGSHSFPALPFRETRAYRTGDVVRQVPGLDFMGRRDAQTKVRGRRVELTEIEDAVLRSSAGGIVQAAATVSSGCLVVWCVLRGGERPSELLAECIVLACREFLPAHFLPRVGFIDAVPVTKTGKIDRAQLSELDPADSLGEFTGLSEEWTEVERLVASTWESELSTPVRSLNSNFIQLGGNSLTAVRVCQLLAAATGLSSTTEGGGTLGAWSPAELMRRPVLRSFASGLSAPQGIAVTSECVAAACESTYLLLEASGRECLASVSILLGSKVDADSRAGRGPTPLQLACGRGCFSIVQLLLEHSASSTTVDAHGASVVHYASQGGSIPVVTALLERKASVVVSDRDSQTPLHYAARAGAPGSLLDALLGWQSKRQQSLTLDCVDVWCRTPLHWAVINGHLTCVRHLLRAGSSPKLRDKAGETPLDMAERRARCDAKERQGERASIWGGISAVLGGSGTTKALKAAARKS